MRYHAPTILVVAFFLVWLLPLPISHAATHVEVAVDQLNIRSAPDTTTQIVATLNKATRLPIVTQKNGWSQVKLANGTTGWVNNKYVKMIDIPRTIYLKSTVELLNVRAEPNATSQILQTITPNGTYLQVKKQGDWVQIKLSNEVNGWVNSRYMTETAAPAPAPAPVPTPSLPAPNPAPFPTPSLPAPTPAPVPTPSLPAPTPAPFPIDGQAAGTLTLQEGYAIFAAPDFLSAVIGELYGGMVLEHFGYANGWYKIRFNGADAYIYKPEAAAPQQPVNPWTPNTPPPAQAEASIRVKNADTNLRSGPGTHYAVVGTAQPGQTFPIVQSEGDWYMIRLPDQSTAYIAGWIVDQVHPTNGTGSPGVGYNAGMIGNETVYIYHTHNRESWRNVARQTQGSSVDDPEINITLVGKRLGELLQQRGIQTMVNQDDFAKRLAEQKKSYAMSYAESYNAVVAAVAANPSLQYIFDIHRDSDEPRSKVALTLNGKTYARMLFVIGTANPNYHENKKLADSLHARLEAAYPGLSRGVILKSKNEGNGEYNQSLSQGSLLLEFGGTNNTLEECYNTAEAFADVLINHMLESRIVFK